MKKILLVLVLMMAGGLPQWWNATNFVPIAYYTNATSLNGSASVAVSGGYAFVASLTGNSLTVFNVTDPKVPVQIAYYTNATSLNGTYSVAVSGGYAFVTGWVGKSLTVFNVTDPKVPVQIAYYTNATSLNNPWSVAVSGGYAFVASYTGKSLTIFNVTDPKVPVQIAYYTNATSLNGDYSVAVSGNYAFVTSFTGNSLTVFNVTDPKVPVQIAYYTNATNLSGAYSVAVSGNYAFVVSWNGKSLTVFNVTDPKVPVQIAYYTNATSLNNPYSVAVSGGYAFVTSLTGNSLTVFNVTDPKAPVQIAYYTNATSLNSPQSVAVSGGYAFVASGTGNSLTIFNVTEAVNYGWLNVSYQSPASGSSQKVNIYDTFGVSVNVTCVGGYCGNVLGTLKFNDTNGLTPNRIVNVSYGVPFYAYLNETVFGISDDNNIQCMDVGDANNDGKNDTVVGRDITSGLNRKIYVNQSGGWTAYNISGDYLAGVRSVAIGDADNDNFNEVVFGLNMSSYGNEVRMYKNTSGTWMETNISGVPGSVYTVAIGDANNDGQKEIVVGLMNGTNELRMYENKSGGWVETNIKDMPTSINRVKVGDADGDGLNEVFVGMSYTTNQTRMYKNVSGGWNETNISDSGGSVYGLDIGDANNDGSSELVVGVDNGVNKFRTYNYTGGKWVESNISSGLPSITIYSLSVGDANNDGINEIVIGSSSTASTKDLRMYVNSSGRWNEYNLSQVAPVTHYIYSVQIKDVNNDGKNEVVVATNAGSVTNDVRYSAVVTNPAGCGPLSSGQTCKIVWLVNATKTSNAQYWLNVTVNSTDGSVSSNSSGNFQINITRPWLNVTYQSPASGSSQNVNQSNTFNVTMNVTCNDFDCGVVWGTIRYNTSGTSPNSNVSRVWGDAPLYIKRGFGPQTLFSETAINPPSSSISMVKVGDADNDGKNEIIAVGQLSDNINVRMYKNNTPLPNATAHWAETNISASLPLISTYSVAIGDANNDLKNEVVIGIDNTTGGGTAYELRVYENKSGNWTETNISDLTNGTGAIDIGDVNNDGLNEIVVTMDCNSLNCARNNTRIYNFTGGSWVETNISSGRRPLNSVAIGDANNDGKIDIVVGANRNSPYIQIYENKSGGWVETNISSSAVYSVRIADANNDGLNEIVAAGSSGFRILNFTGGSWVETTINSNGLTGSRADVGDVNNDGANDIVATTNNDFRMYENKSGTWVESNISISAGSPDYVTSGDADNDNVIEVVGSTGANNNDLRVYENLKHRLSCGYLYLDQTCTITWIVNATGLVGTQYWLDVNFSSVGNRSEGNDSGDFQINITSGAPADSTAPNIDNFKYNVTNMTNYSFSQGYQFNATIVDANLDKVWIEHNFTGAMTNNTVLQSDGNEYYYDYGRIAGGFYYIKWWANDTYGNTNSTDYVKYYQINRSYLPMTLYINGTDGDKTLYNNSVANFTANFTTGYPFNITLWTNLTGTMAFWYNQTSPLTNYTELSPYQARNYTILANWTGNQNYTYSQANHSLTLQYAYGWLNVSYQSPANGSSQNVTQYDTFNVTMNVTCVGGSCGSVTGVLRYNNSNGINPDTVISNIIGATPFYAINGSPTTFAETNISFSDPSTSGMSVVIGDVNNDGKNEVVAGVTGGVKLYQNISGTWVGNYIKMIGNSNPQVAIGDANNDGLNETVIGMGTTTNGTRIYENKSGGWVETNISDPGSVLSVAIGDANRDGQNEVVVGMESTTNEVRMYQNTSGTWVETNISDEPARVMSVAIGDANRDGYNEVVVGMGYSGVTTKLLRMYENKSGGWVEMNISDFTNNVQSIAIGDANNDGKNEIVIGGLQTTSGVGMYENKSGTWVETNISNTTYINSVAIGDANNDGKNETVIGMELSIKGVRMYENKSGTWVETNISDPRGVRVNSVAVGDANNDGKNEVVIGGQFNNGTRMYELSSNPLSCWSLYSGQTCQLSWTVNATGSIGTQYWLDSNFTSNYSSVPANDSGNFQINISATADNTLPNIANLKQNVSNMSLFSATQGYQFNATVTDNSAVDDVWIRHNFTGTLANYTITTANGNEYYYNYGVLPVGYYQYQWWANDTSNNVNSSELRYYRVNNTAPPNISFVPPTPDNGTGQNISSVYVNVSTNASNPGSAFIDWNRSLVGWWRFNSENDFTDYSSYGNNGTNFSSTYNSSGKLGGARRFDGVNDFIDVGNSSSLKLTTGEITVEVWIKIFGNGVNYGRIVLGGGVNSAYTLVKYDAGDDRMYWRPRASNNTIVTSTSAVTRNEWHHIVGTYNASASSVRLYIDGVLNNSAADTGNLQTHPANVLIGGANVTHDGANSWFDGLIDEVKIYRRTLSPEEINASYNAGTYRLYRNFTGLSDGNYTYTAYAQDIAGNVNQTETRTVVIDTVPPNVNFTYPTPSNGSTITQNSVYVNVTVNDASATTAFIDWNNNLVGWWRFNNATDFTDYSGYGNNGTNYGSNYTSAGRLGGGRQFDGSTGYINVGNTSILSSITNAITISAWVKISTANTYIVVDKFASSSPNANKGYSLTIFNGNIRFSTGNGTSDDYDDTVSIADGNWHYAAITYNGTHKAIYRDGNRVQIKAWTADIIDCGKALQIGKRSDLATYLLNGTIDEVQIYKRALSAQEINASYNAGLYRLERNFTDLSNGAYNFTAYAQDIAGNVNQTETRSVIVQIAAACSVSTPTVLTANMNCPGGLNITNPGILNTNGWNVTVGSNIFVEGGLNASGTASIVNSTGQLIVSSNANVTQGTGLFNFTGGYLQNGTNSSFVGGGNVSVVGNTNLSAGTLTGASLPSWWTSNGNFTNTGGTITGYTLNLLMLANGTTFTSGLALGSLRVSAANVTMTGTAYTPIANGLTIDSGDTFTIPSSATIDNNMQIGFLTNNGTITGTGTLWLQYYSSSPKTLISGVVNCPARIYVSTPSNVVINLGSNTTFGSTLLVNSGSIYNATLAGNGYTLTVLGLTTLGENATMNQGTGTWNFSGGYLQNGANSNFTQGGDIWAGDVTISAGTFTPLSTKTITSTGSFNSTIAEIGTLAGNLIMTGTGKTLYTVDDNWMNTLEIRGSTTLNGPTQRTWCQDLTVSGTFTINGYTYDGNLAYSFLAARSLNITGAVVINAGKSFAFETYTAPNTWSNTGSITGPGTFVFSLRAYDVSITPGVISAPINIMSGAAITGSRSMTLTGNLATTGNLSVYSLDASYIITLVGNGYTLNATGLTTLGTRGTITQGTGQFNFSGGYLQNGTNSSFTQGANVSVTGNTTISAGQLTGSASYYWLQYGNFTQTGGTIANSALNLVMGTDNTIISISQSYLIVPHLIINGNVTYTSSHTLFTGPGSGLNLVVLGGKTLNISSADGTVEDYLYSGAGGIANSGTITGIGTFVIDFYNADANLNLSNMTFTVSMFKIWLEGSSAANHIATLTGNLATGGAFQVYSNQNPYSMTLNGNGYNLTVAGLTTLGSDGAMVQGTGLWNFSGGYLQNGVNSSFTQGGNVYVRGNFNLTAGTFIGPSSSSVLSADNFTQNGGNATINAGNLNITTDVIINGTFSAGSGTISVGRNWNSTYSDFHKETASVYLLGTGTLQVNYGWGGGEYPFWNISLAYPTKTTTMVSGFYSFNLYLNNGTLVMGNNQIYSYGDYIEPRSHIYGNGTITSTGGYLHLRVGGDYGRWNNTIWVPYLSIEGINLGTDENRTLNMTSNMNVLNVLQIVGYNAHEQILRTGGYNISTGDLSIGDTAIGHAWILANNNERINVSGNLDIYNGSKIEATTAIVNVSKNTTIKSGGALIGSANLNNLTIESGAGVIVSGDGMLTLYGNLTLGGDLNVTQGTLVNISLNGTKFSLNGSNVAVRNLLYTPPDSVNINISKYVNITDLGSGMMNLNISYVEAALGCSETELSMYRYDGANWNILASTGIDAARDIVYGNSISAFGVFAPMCSKYGWLNVSYQSPVAGSSQEVGQGTTFTVNMDVKCIGWDCGNVIGTLRYNASNGLNPDTNISDVLGATPFYASTNSVETIIKDEYSSVLSVAIGDANNDGKQDAVVVGPNVGPRIYENKTGTWVETIINASGGYSMAVGDANNDGLNEVVVGTSAKLAMYQNMSGGWVEKDISNVPTVVESIAIGDANNDGKNDIVIGMYSAPTVNEVRIYENKSGGWVETNISDMPSTVWSVAIGDANNDGLKEMVIGVDTATNRVRMYENKTGTWVETNISNPPVRVYSVAIGDANNDLKNEVVIGLWQTTPNRLRMYENKSGTWVETNISVGDADAYYYIIKSVAIGDANNDGQNDVVIGINNLNNNKKLRMYENRSGGWQETNISDTPDDIRSVAIGNANGDGKNEIIIGMDDTIGELRVYEINNNPPSCGYLAQDQTCHVVWIVNVTGTPGTRYWLDANFSSKSSMGPSNDSGNFQVNILPYYGWLNVSYQSPANGSSQNVTQYSNFNVSLNVTCVGGGTCGNVSGVLRYNASSGLNPDTNVSAIIGAVPFYAQTGEPAGFAETNIKDFGGVAIKVVAIGDANNDGKDELVISVVWDNAIRMYENKSGVWVETNISSMYPDYVNSVAIGDADNDGQNEVVIGGYNDNQTRMYKNTTGTWVETNIGDLGYYEWDVYSVAIGDADNDGQNEVVIGWGGFGEMSNELRMYENKSGTWVETNISDEDSDVYSVAIGDADNDGKNEVAIGGYFSNGVKIYENESDDWIGTNISDNVNMWGESVAIGDANNDGLNEVIFGMEETTYRVMMYENKSGGWQETNISLEPAAVYSVAIGDADNDGKNEVAIGIDSGYTPETKNEVRMYENKSGAWVETNISDEDSDVLSIAIGDANNDGLNEVAIGLNYDNNEVRIYSLISNPLSCSLSLGQTCTMNWVVNATGLSQYWLDVNFTSSDSQVHANDSGNFQINITDNVPPWIGFVSPTPDNGTLLTVNSVYVNVSVNDTNLGSAFIDWNKSLVGWWRFNNNTDLLDYSTYGNNGTSVGQTIYTSSGAFGGGLTFNKSQYISATIGNGIPTGTAPRTMSAWFKTTALPAAGGNLAIVAYGTAIVGKPIVMMSINSSGSLYSETGSGADRMPATAPVNDGIWHMAALTYNGTVESMYLDGVLVGAITTALGTNSSFFGIGVLPWDTSVLHRMNGSIDEAQLYNRALTPQEINASYNVGAYRLERNFTGLSDGNYTYRAYAQDRAGNVNSTEERLVVIDTMPPKISFVYPTENDSTTIYRNTAYVNVSANDTNLGSVFVDWNRSLVGWWRFNNATDLIDYSSYGNNGTNYGSSYTTGKLGGARAFNGSGSYLDAGSGSSLGAINPVSIEAWVKITSNHTETSVGHVIASSYWYDHSTYGGYIFFIRGTGAKLGFRLHGGVGYNNETSSPDDLSLNQWYHVVGTYNGSVISVYVNGVLKNTSYFVNPIPTAGLTIGKASWVNSAYLNGTIDDVMVFNRALSPEEVNASYNAGLYRLERNFTGLSDGTYTFRAYAQDLIGNINQTELRTVTVEMPGWLNVSYQSPVTGNSQKVSQYDTVNVSMNVTCVGGSCGSVTGVLRYNNSNGINPDTSVSAVAGATPFYAAIGSPSTFAETNISDLPKGVHSVKIGDVNNDGQNEVVIGMERSSSTDELRMYENKSGTWVETNISDEDSDVYSVAIGDANNDGNKDLVIGMWYDTNGVRMYENKSGKWVEMNISNGLGSVYSVAIGDVNNDGKNEVVIGMYDTTNEVRMYENRTGGWIETNISDEPGSVESVAIGDANNDGKNETVIGLYSGNNKIRMYENKTGTWVETNISDEPNIVWSVALGDANNDGKNDVVIVMGTTSNATRMYENKSGGWVETNISNVISHVYSVAIGDVNNDGKNEMAIGTTNVTLPFNYNFRMYENKTGKWVETNVSDPHRAVSSLDIGDANNDGKNEAVIGIADGASPPYTQNNIRMYGALSNPLSCGSLAQGQTCTLSWTVNATGTPGTQYWLDSNFSSSYSYVPANDSGNFQVNITTPWLDVTLVAPPLSSAIFRYRTFDINVTVTCLGGAHCNDVMGYASYNLTSNTVPNVRINTTAGDVPFYNFSGANPYSCPNLASGQSCNYSISVNATGGFQSEWLLNVTFNSTQLGLPSNSTPNFKLVITPITGCMDFISCAYPNCLYYTDEVITIQSADAIHKVGSTVRRCWS